jgi:hypothetical protein
VQVVVGLAGEVAAHGSTPAKAGCAGSMPVSSTATTTPLPSNGDVSAFTARTWFFVTERALPRTRSDVAKT